jgi:hypothetical protein
MEMEGADAIDGAWKTGVALWALEIATRTAEVK